MSPSRPIAISLLLPAIALCTAGCQSIPDFLLSRKESGTRRGQPQRPIEPSNSGSLLSARSNVAPPSKRTVTQGPQNESTGFVLKPTTSSDAPDSQSLERRAVVFNLDDRSEKPDGAGQNAVEDVGDPGDDWRDLDKPFDRVAHNINLLPADLKPIDRLEDLDAKKGFELELTRDDQHRQPEEAVHTADVSGRISSQASSKNGVILVVAESVERIDDDLLADAFDEVDKDENDAEALLFANEIAEGVLDGDEFKFKAPLKVAAFTISVQGSQPVEEGLALPAPMNSAMPAERYPIDLPTVLRLAGADNWNIQLAIERIRESDARLESAQALWMPSLIAGIGYTKHDGQLQATEGPVTDISRNSLFVGGGAGIGQSPLTGGAGGPARLFVDLSLADAIFEPLAARQLLNAAGARQSAVFNDTLANASLGYYSLVEAQGRLADAGENSDSAQELLKLTEAFVTAGKGSEADSARAGAEAKRRQQEVVQAKLAVTVASAQLARILQMDPRKLSPESVLQAPEAHPVPIELVDESSSLEALIAQGQSIRPEVSQNQSELEAARRRVQAERWRPWIPSVRVGASAGGFGGGVNDNIPKVDGRSDFDLLAVWELKNLGFGTRAAQRTERSKFRQARLESFQLQDTIATEVITAFHEVKSQREQMALSESSLKQARLSYIRNIARIRGLEGLPLEAVQALQALADARQRALSAKIGYNRAQIRLLRAIGRPVEIGVDEEG